eukprot:TRINITY_DN1127_c0_g1_i3.p1 TRINITY_DN1127_c0_g1~~TRINITY_DN1127_c0_g1_i3.p1  ORF type:complete len:186 (-),score=53.37 TRINITY_DN1127_c0_g1_i3:174-659(-)
MSSFPSELEQEYRDAFNFFDEKQKIPETPPKKGQPPPTGHPGQLSPKTVRTLLRSLGEDPSDQEITSMCQSNGMMTADNFVANRRAKWERAHCVDAVIEAFRAFDQNDGGFVDCAIIKDVLSRYGTEPLSRSEVEDLCNEAGASGGKFNYRQFSETMLQKQ